MPLPDLIEIIPPAGIPSVSAITIPGSKSITNRALILAAMASGPVTLRGALWSEDTQVMTGCLRTMGFPVEVLPDPAEEANRILRIEGAGGTIPRAGTAAEPLDLFVGNAGTAARFLAALCCLGRGAYRLSGVPRMHERPQAGLLAALRTLGYRVDSPNDRLPAVLHGTGPRAARCEVSVAESSQFASALLMPSRLAGWEIGVTGANPDEMPYVEMTRRLMETFPHGGGSSRSSRTPRAAAISGRRRTCWDATGFRSTTGRIPDGRWTRAIHGSSTCRRRCPASGTSATAS